MSTLVVDPRRAVNGEAHSTTAPTAISLNQVSKRFDNGRMAVDALSLTVGAGEFISLVGPSGCGKSTLLRIVAGLTASSSGEVHVFGQAPAAARRQHRTISYVFQEPTLMPWRTVLDNVALPLELNGVSLEERRARGQWSLDRVGLGDTASLYPRQLSGGMKMRVSIARAMCVEPRLMLMDEPFAAIDEINRKRLNDDLHNLWTDAQFTALFVTHNIYEAVFLSTRIVVLTPNPARIAGVVPVSYPLPRSDEFRESRLFAELVREVWQLLEA